MATTIVWSIENMIVIPSTGEYVNYAWRVNAKCTGTNSSGASTFYTYTITFDPSNQTEPYTPYASLTQDEVILWVQNMLGATAVTNIQNSISDQLSAVPMPLPWA